MKKLLLIIPIVVLLIAQSCNDDSEQPSRTFRMGFMNSAPRLDNIDLFIQSLNLWTPRADAAIISTEVPWEALLNGTPAPDYVVANFKTLADFYRERNLVLWVYIDPQNGLDRTSDALELIDAGKSIADPEMQAIYRRFVVVMDSVLKPDHLGLALETNLIRAASSPAIYEGVKAAVNDAASDIRIRNPHVPLSISVQAEQAWGKFTKVDYIGIAQDFTDFPFIQELGISSYPYFVFDSPADIPSDYYSRIIGERRLPVFVSEGGWTSQSLSTPIGEVISSPEAQRDYFKRHAELLASVNATAWFQLVFTDIDLDHLPENVPDNIDNFCYLGLVDKDFVARPALNVWDEIFQRKRKP